MAGARGTTGGASSRGTIGLGVIGCGNIAYWTHLRIARHLDGATLVATADPDPAARSRAEGLTSVPSHDSAEALLARRDVDAVIIASPTHLHAELMIASAAARKHVYLEKPLASTVADGARVVEAATGAGITVMLGFNRRYHPLFAQVRDLLQAGRLGRVRTVQTTFCELVPIGTMPKWKQCRETGGGVLLDLASHHVDLLRWCLGDEVATVRATIDSDASDHDSARLHLTMRSGVHVQSAFSFRTATSDSFEFAGDGGTLRVDRHRAAVSLRVPRRFGYGMRSAWVTPPTPVAAWWLERLARPSREPSYRRALAAFVDVLRGQARPVSGLVDGMRALEVVAAAEESAARGRAIELPATSSP